MNRSGILFLFTFVWRQAYFPETSASEPKGDRLNPSWRSTDPCLYDTQFKLGGFVGLVSFWCTTGCATLLGKCRRSHFVCTGQCGCTKVDANCRIKRCYSSLTLIKKKKYKLNIFKEIKRSYGLRKSNVLSCLISQFQVNSTNSCNPPPRGRERQSELWNY